ncbi:cysteinyl-tRNA synthetase [Neoconidiobolus thromboides FSU 785]|nr:cysteinyl-tRNA synthetase [Neoconidiobolus thromboides FSU 785]
MFFNRLIIKQKPLHLLTLRTINLRIMSTTRESPIWHPPTDGVNLGLKVFNTLTKSKVPFVANEGNLIKWYNCGPTVYDSSHMGHARNYVTVDILRRILSDYFGYNITFVMNITDIDDKIILRARQNYLFDNFMKENKSEKELVYLKESFSYYLEKKLNAKDLNNVPANEDPKFKMYLTAATQANDSIIKIEELIKDSVNNQEKIQIEFNNCKDILANYLDLQKGSEVTDPKIFRELAAYWENDFMQDMKALNVLPADIVTRVSEYVPEIISFVETIIAKGYGYEIEGSVYFNTQKFDQNENHYYAKLEPYSANNIALIQDGEGSLSSNLTGKINSSDFALWKKSKPGEPAWNSPWGMGRPGWHIECSAMASEIFGENMDIHSGGEDLAFPHHDNELAQSEAHHGCKQWVNYFLHTGHLHIEGQKMSKSLKNFITIKEALEKYSARQLRLTFLMHPWDNGMDFKTSSMQETMAVEKLINNFLINVKAMIQEKKNVIKEFDGNHDFYNEEKEMLKIFNQKQKNIHNALLDSFNTPLAIRELTELINKSNIYLKNQKENNNIDLINKIALYIMKMLNVFGLNETSNDIGFSNKLQGTESSEDQIMPYLQVLSKFRDNIRSLARENSDNKQILKVCDNLRDHELAELGVLLDDREDGKALVKFVDKESLIKERELKLKNEELKKKKKEEAAKLAELKRLEKLEKGKLDPKVMFQNNQFSKWDEMGIPTFDNEGNEIAKSRRKKLTKEYELQSKLHQEYLNSLKQ